MRRLILIAYLFSCAPLPYKAFAQEQENIPVTRAIDSLYTVLKSQKDDTDKVNTLNILSTKYKIFGNYDSALLHAKNAQVLAEKIGFKKGIAEALGNLGVISFRQSNYQKALEYQFKSFIIYQDIRNTEGIANALNDIGLIYHILGNYSQALKCDFKALNILPKTENTHTLASILCNIGIIYGEQGNYSKALDYFFRSLKIQIAIGYKDGIAIDLGDIGWNYLMQGDYPKALEYDFKAVAQAQEVGDKEVTANFFGDIGNIYYKEGDYTRALEDDFKAISTAREIGDMDDIAIIYSNIGEVYTKLKNYKRAKIFLDSALNLSKQIGDKKYIKITYRNLAVLDSTTGNYKIAYSDYKEYMDYRDSLTNQGTTQMEIGYEFEKREDSIRLEEDSIRIEYEKENIIKTAEINRKKILNDGIIVILALTVLLTILFINRQQVKRKKDSIISEKERAMLILENQRMETENQRMEAEKQRIADELVNARKALEDHTKSMGEKNDLLEQFKIDMDKLKILKSKELEDMRIEQLYHLNKTTILTEDDWGKFKELFEQVHKGFIIRLKERLPDLTQAEVRLICLTKLSLGTKQMANILGVSSDTIKKTRHRLRKKLGMSEEVDIEEIIKYI